MKKKILAAVLTVCMIMTMTPAMAFADTDSGYRSPAAPADPIGPVSVSVKDFSDKITPAGETAVADLNGVKYASVQEAIDAAVSGDTITLLGDTNESITINKGSITLDLNDFTLYTNAADDVVTVDYIEAGNQDPIIKDGYIFNLTDTTDDIKTAIYARSSIDAHNVTAMVSGTGQAGHQGSVFYIESGVPEFFDCEVFYDEKYASGRDWIDGVYIDSEGFAIFENCSIETLNGDCCYIEGDARFEKCYFAANSDDNSAIYIGKNNNDGEVTISSGYFYGDPPLYSDSRSGIVDIHEGEFVSAYSDVPVVGGYPNAFNHGVFSELNIIANVPGNEWKLIDYAYIYYGAPAPSSFTTNLTAVKGQKAGYDDIRAAWKTPASSRADGYRVNYYIKGKPDTGGAKFLKKTATGSCNFINLLDGYKYTIVITPYVWVNEDILEDGGKKCYSNKAKTSYTYTLKKVVLNKFTKSKGKVKVTWKNINGETGYQISKSTKKTGTNIVYTYKTTTGNSKLIKATKGKTYYYKVRAYKTINGKKIFGPWSAVKAYKR